MSDRILEGLEPERVFYYFEEISKIPRPSFKEKAISDYLVSFAKDHGLSVIQDDLYNIIMVKEASEGCEDKEPIILQGHMDMVCEKEADCPKDMDNEGLDLYIEDDFIHAQDTTLGGDDGIAIAYALALLEDDSLKHPRLEVVITVSEETGMEGAKAIDLSSLKGKQFINLDSEDEGIILSSCAGGGRLSVDMEVERDAAEGEVFIVKVGGLLGGHSGSDIHRGRANAILILARILRSSARKINVKLIEFTGGGKDNAIPRNAEAKVLVPVEVGTAFMEIVETESKKIVQEYNSTDSGMCIEIKESNTDKLPLTTGDTNRIIRMLLSLPNGVVRMSYVVEGLVETSLNLGIIDLKEGSLSATYALRSSVASAYEALRENMLFFIEGVGAKASIKSEYPAWEYKEHSPLRETMAGIYTEMFGSEPKIEAIHAGLECGLLAEKIENLDAVSIGPQMYDVHTPAERLSISSTKRTYEFVRKVIETMAEEKNV